MMDNRLLREVVLDQRDQFRSQPPHVIEREQLEALAGFVRSPHAVVISGVRRGGKSTLLRQIARRYYPDAAHCCLSFEDERLLHFSAADFDSLLGVFAELGGDTSVFFLDEVQVVDGWERFVRRMVDRGTKFYLTGSNASLLSREIGSRLTGRHLTIELFPFSFRECLEFASFHFDPKRLHQVEYRGKLKGRFHEYLRSGGMPEYVRFGEREILRSIYADILYRDIVARHRLGDVRMLREVAYYLLSNLGNLASFNKVKSLVKAGSVNTVTRYAEYLADGYLIFTVNKLAWSIKEQLIAPKKVYCVDNGICDVVGFRFSANEGRFLENAVYLALRRTGREVFYYVAAKGREVDFVVRDGARVVGLYQVCYDLTDPDTKQREVAALAAAMAELDLDQSFLLTYDDEETVRVDSKTIHVLPVYKWLLLEGKPPAASAKP